MKLTFLTSINAPKDIMCPKDFETNKERTNMKLAQKLVAQWEQFGKLVIAFDFDDTVYPFTEGYNPEPVLKALRTAKAQGHTLICFTCRSDQRVPESYCKVEGIEYDYFNESPINNNVTGHGKPYYNIFLDDKAGLGEALSQLEHALSIIGVKQKIQISF